MKSVLISIRPQWCELIASGKKTIEVRKSAPKLETPFKVYVYQTKHKGKSIVSEALNTVYGGGKVIGSFVCDRVFELKINGDDCGNYWHDWDDEGDIQDMCLSYEELETYLGKSVGYGWHITAPTLFDKPKELGEFRKVCLNGKCSDCIYEECKITRPPQSWCYVEELQ